MAWFLFMYSEFKEELENTKGVIIIRKSNKNRQHNNQQKRDKVTNNDLKNITQKTKDRVSWTPLKHVLKSGAPEW
jgi:hypothetical protein